MNTTEDLKKILSECEKSNNYDNYNKQKKILLTLK